MGTAGRVLIIDDNPKNIQVAASILQQSGFDCEFALNGASGLNWLETKPFDVVLMDVMMPNEDGFQICRLIKSHHQLKKIPVIFVTAKADRESVVTGFDSGGEDYITKPFDSKELLARVKNQVELKKNREKLEQMNSNLEDMVEEKVQKITETNQKLEQTNKELFDSLEELKRIEQSKQHFLNILGNETSGSLNEITGMMQVIKYKVDSKKVAQLIDRVDHSLSKIETIVNAALRITELQSKGTLLKPERIDLNKLIGFAIFHLDDKIRRKQLKVNNLSSRKPVFITGESQLLMAAFIITIDFFLERNASSASITIEIENTSLGTTIVYKDDGALVSDKDIESFFDTFYTGSQSLSFVKLIAEAHLGSLEIKNRNDSNGIALSITI